MKSSPLLLATALWLAVSSSSAVANEIFKIDPAHSTIAFKVRHLLGTAKGKFTKFSGAIDVDRERPENSSVTVSIQAASIDTAIAKRDEHLRGEDFFNVGKYPEITFNSRRVKLTGPTAGEITGDLTMHGEARDHPSRSASRNAGISREKSDHSLARDDRAHQTQPVWTSLEQER